MSSLGENSSPIKGGAAISSGRSLWTEEKMVESIASPGPVFANVGGTPYMLALEPTCSTLSHLVLDPTRRLQPPDPPARCGASNCQDKVGRRWR